VQSNNHIKIYGFLKVIIMTWHDHTFFLSLNIFDWLINVFAKPIWGGFSSNYSRPTTGYSKSLVIASLTILLTLKNKDSYCVNKFFEILIGACFLSLQVR
jgi:hypothetical protein